MVAASAVPSRMSRTARSGTSAAMPAGPGGASLAAGVVSCSLACESKVGPGTRACTNRRRCAFTKAGGGATSGACFASAAASLRLSTSATAATCVPPRGVHMPFTNDTAADALYGASAASAGPRSTGTPAAPTATCQPDGVANATRPPSARRAASAPAASPPAAAGGADGGVYSAAYCANDSGGRATPFRRTVTEGARAPAAAYTRRVLSAPLPASLA